MVPPHQHDELASAIMSTLASHPFSASQLRIMGPGECSRHFPVFTPVIYAIASVLDPGRNADAARLSNPQFLPRPAPLPAPLPPPFQLQNNFQLPNLPRAQPLSVRPPPVVAQSPQRPDLDAIFARLLQPPRHPRQPTEPPRAGISDVVCITGPPAEGDGESLEAPVGLKEETRKISKLRRKNRAAYDCAVEKLEQARSKSEIGLPAREWIKRFVRLPLWEEEPSGAPLSDSQQRDKLYEARDALNNAAAGHEEAKALLLDRYTMWLRNPGGPGMVLGIQGPPGNGKTTLVEHGLSTALGRHTETIDMGGIGDPQILRGDRSLWVGSSHGRIADCLMRAGTRRMIIILEEVDKVTKAGVQHVISNLTDPNRNSSFEDSYFSGVPLDLSMAMIVCTFNEPQKLDGALLSRMGRIVETSALSEADKTEIAERFLIPKALKDVNRVGAMTLDGRAIRYMIRLCGGEEGARGLKALIERVVGATNTTMIERGLPRYEVSEADARRLFGGAGRT